jgi:hypothetical protein
VLYRLRLVTAVAAVLVAVFVAGLNVAARGPIGIDVVPAGATRYAFASAADAQNTTSTSFANIPNLAASFTVGSGKTAEASMTFSGELNGCSAIYVQAVLDGSTIAAPGPAQVFWPFAGSGAASHSFTFYAKNIGPGKHTARIQWSELTNCNQAFISVRSLVVTANIH